MSIDIVSDGINTSTRRELVTYADAITEGRVHITVLRNAAGPVSVSSAFVPDIPDFSNVAEFGTGADGDVTISSGTTTLTRDMHYRKLTINGSGKLVPGGWKIYVSVLLDLSGAGAGAINMAGVAGNNGSGANGGAGIVNANGFGNTTAANGSVPQSQRASSTVTGVGGTGTTATGAAGGAGYYLSPAAVVGGVGGAGASGGAGVSAGALGGAAAVSNSVTFQFPTPGSPLVTYQSNQVATPLTIVPGIYGGGGGAGGGDGTNAGGGGGSCGGSGGGLDIAAAIIARGTNTTAGILSVAAGISGDGANGPGGNAGGGGGGGGSGGGFARILAGRLTGTPIVNAIDASGAAGGKGGNGLGTGKGGNGGTGGNGGNIQVTVLQPASFTVSTFNAAGTVGSTTATATGASGGAGAITRANL